MPDCIFCKIIKREIPTDILEDHDRCIVLQDRNPLAPVHLLVIATRHIESLSTGLRDDHTIPIEDMLQVATSLGDEKCPNGYRLMINTGKDAGQINHLHIHVIGGAKLPDHPRL